MTMELADDGRIARFREWWHRASRRPTGLTQEEDRMAGDVSFDVVSDFDQQELRNALDQVRREVGQRYDFKGATSSSTRARTRSSSSTDDEYRAAAVKDLIESKAIRRNLSLKIFDWGKVEPAGGNTVRQEIRLRRGLPDDLAKRITKLIRDEFPKVQVADPGRRGARMRQEQGRAAEGHHAAARARRARAAPVPELPLRCERDARSPSSRSVVMIAVVVVIVFGLDPVDGRVSRSAFG